MNHTDSTRRLRLAALSALAAAFALPATPAFAQVLEERPQEDVVGMADEPMIEEEQIEPDEYSVDAGVTFSTHYYFRGILQEADGLLNGGLITQPYVEIGFPLVAEDAYSVDAYVGTWNSVHSAQTGADGAGPATWYESDIYGGVGVSTGNFELGALYTFYLSPHGAFSEIQEVGGFASYGVDIGDDPDIDDEVVLSLGFGAGIYYEVKDETGENAYLELGAEAATEVEIDGFEDPIALAFPVTVGLSLDEYYTTTVLDGEGEVESEDDEFFGFVSVAAAATFPLTPGGKYGSWSITPAVEGLFLGDALETEDGDDVELIGSLSLDVSF